MGAGFDISPLPARAYGPVREEDECGMVVNAGLDSAEPGSSTQDTPGRDRPGGGDAASGFRNGAGLPDPRKLAQDWITLWQSELSAMAVDPEMRESWRPMMALWAGTMSSVLRGMPRAATSDRYERARGQAGTADAPRPPPAAAAPDARDAEIERLARHVAALERRLAEHERGSDPAVDPKRRSARKPRK